MVVRTKVDDQYDGEIRVEKGARGSRKAGGDAKLNIPLTDPDGPVNSPPSCM